ncbi:hypothetical protein RI367_001252 [Sorochytrium milnesiophthora]
MFSRLSRARIACRQALGDANSSTRASSSSLATRWSSTIARKPLFDKILIANRGEIACRVMRTAQKLGVKCVAVYSEADRASLHVQMADEAYLIGPAPSAESYLRMDRIIDVANRTGAQAIHPGYGFLSENAEFARQLHKNDIVFIGPPEQAIIDMGSKSASKDIMSAAKVPVVPGYHGEEQHPKFLEEQADSIGYPVLIKAVMGGGGKGMRIVERKQDFQNMLESARREATKSFGDDRVLVEKYLVTPRHVEVQVFADSHGNAVHLFERDCSVQRRHQKIIEEAPGPGLSSELRADLGAKAVAAAKAVGYRGAGTVEFIMDNLTKTFYFMEMNTRLQVEHPVTEMITGTDLVEWQLEVAAGNRLPMLQDDLKILGHAFEARIYAENPDNGFLPDTGPLLHLRTPETSSNLRVETGVLQGDQVSVYYDPMIAKLVVRADDRNTALKKLRKALGEYEVVGLNTNIEFLKTLSAHPGFVAGDVETGFIKKHEAELFRRRDRTEPEAVVSAIVSLLARNQQQVTDRTAKVADKYSPWGALAGARLNTHYSQSFQLKDGDRNVSATVEFANGKYNIQVNAGPDQPIAEFFDVTFSRNAADSAKFDIDIGPQKLTPSVVIEQDRVHVFDTVIGKRTFVIPEPTFLSAGKSETTGSVRTPMPCKISQVLVKPGDKVEKGAPLIVLEAMKMEHMIRAPFDGVVERVNYKIGDLVAENKLLLTFADEADAAAKKSS